MRGEGRDSRLGRADQYQPASRQSGQDRPEKVPEQGRAPPAPPPGGYTSLWSVPPPRLCTGLAGAAVLPSSGSCRPKGQDWGGLTSTSSWPWLGAAGAGSGTEAPRPALPWGWSTHQPPARPRSEAHAGSLMLSNTLEHPQGGHSKRTGTLPACRGASP